MCGRYTYTATEKVKGRFNLAAMSDGLTPNYNVAPTQMMPVIKHGEHGNELEVMRWGIPRFVGPGKVTDVFNTRSDKAFGSWKKLVLNQRVLVPATGFYEWKREGAIKQPYFIHPKHDEMFAFAGIWNRWKREDGQEIDTYSIMTTEPNAEMAGIHNRMPVILHPENEAAWLSPDNDSKPDSIGALLRPYEDHGLELYAVSTDVNSARVNDAHLMKRL